MYHSGEQIDRQPARRRAARRFEIPQYSGAGLFVSCGPDLGIDKFVFCLRKQFIYLLSISQTLKIHIKWHDSRGRWKWYDAGGEVAASIRIDPPSAMKGAR